MSTNSNPHAPPYHHNRRQYHHISQPPPATSAPATAPALSAFSSAKADHRSTASGFSSALPTTLPQRANATGAAQSHPSDTMSCLYNSQSPGKTILITSEPCGSSSSVNVNGNAASQITIFTHHHHHASNASKDAAADQPGPVGINIMINNHFNEPLPLPPLPTKPSEPKSARQTEAITIKSERLPKSEATHVGVAAAMVEEDSGDSGDADSDLSEVAMADSTAATSPKATGTADDVGSSSCSVDPAAITTTTTTTTTATSTSVPVTENPTLPQSAAAPAAPPMHLAVHDEVFVGQPDGRFHLGTIVALGPGRCLVRFADGRESWSAQLDVQRFSAPDVVAPMCIVCKQTGAAEVAQQCCECGRAYHARCAGVDANGVWFCRRRHRNEPLPMMARLDEPTAVTDVVMTTSDDDERRAVAVALTKRTRQLPYKLAQLTWDKNHHKNVEDTYCYCGCNGQWHMQMLQCRRCAQWFHEKCIDVLTYPLYCGDLFYVFACALCNGGTEFVRRQQITFDDLVHLLLYNLSVHNEQRSYFEVAGVIVPYAIDNWHMLQLTPELRSLSVAEIHDRITKILSSNKARYKKRVSLTLRTNAAGDAGSQQFGLYSRHAPPAGHTVRLNHLPHGQPLSDDLLAACIQPAQQWVSILPDGGSSAPVSALLAQGKEMRYTMSGRAYMAAKETAASNESDDEVLANMSASKRSKMTRTARRTVDRPTQHQHQSGQSNGSTVDASDIYEYCSDLEDQQPAPIALRPSLSASLVSSPSSSPLPAAASPSHADRDVRKSSPPSTAHNQSPADAAADSPSSNQKQQQQQQQQHQHHQHKRKRGHYPLAASTIATAMAETFALNGTVSREHFLKRLIPMRTDYLGQNNPFLLAEPSPPPLPPPLPATVTGRSRARGKGKGAKGSGSVAAGASVFGAAIGAMATGVGAVSTATTVRLVKRRLSAKDLVFGANMEVKRRRVCRVASLTGDRVELIRTAQIQPAVAVAPKRTDFRDLSLNGTGVVPPPQQHQQQQQQQQQRPASSVNRSDDAYGVGGRRLRKRMETNYSEGRRSGGASSNSSSSAAATAVAAATNSNSCSSTSSGVSSASTAMLGAPYSDDRSVSTSAPSISSSAADAKDDKIRNDVSSLMSYIGVANRIANGERFTICGKRIRLDGREQYLIEWQTVS